MKTPTVMIVGILFAAAARSVAAVPLTEKIGTVTPDIFHAMSGNFTVGHGYTGDLTLLAPAASLKPALRIKRVPVAIEFSDKQALNEFNSAKSVLVRSDLHLNSVAPALNSESSRTVPDHAR